MTPIRKSHSAPALIKLPEIPAEEKWVVHASQVISIWAKAYLGKGAGKGDVQRFITAMKAEPENAKVFSAARNNGDLVYPGDEIKIPKAYLKAGLAPAIGNKTLETLRASATTMADAADGVKKSGKPLSEPQLKRVREELASLNAARELSGAADHIVANRLRAHLPDGDALKAPQLPAHAPPDDQARVRAQNLVRDLAIMSQGKQHTRDQRMAVGQTFSQFPDLAKSKAGKELMAQQPISPAQAKAGLGAELKRVAAQVGDNTMSIIEWSQAGYLVQQVARFAPSLLEEPEGKALKAKLDGVAAASAILE